MAICEYTHTYFGVDPLMHLTCTNLTVDELKKILKSARDMGIKNILALRGDPPRGAISWEPTVGGCENAIDLVKRIRKEHGDYFCIAVAGFPEGHPHSKISRDQELVHLKEKINAGADFILTQFFYDADVFVDFHNQCRQIGIDCPIIPGMMPIQSYISFKKMTTFCKTKVPDHIWKSLEPIRENDEEIKEYGVRLCVQLCDTLRERCFIKGFHFYTLNLEKSVMAVLAAMGVQESVASRRAFPWRGSRANLKGMSEDVRPINWANRPKSYIKRTITWDEFPNGRWGDNRSPAYGELSDSHFFRPVEGSKEDLLAMWGEAPIDEKDVNEVFALYLEGKIPILPWCETALNAETIPLCKKLASLNRAGFLSINSQPAVNGAKSTHPIYGWGGPSGRVYQKAYIEFFVNPELLKSIIHVLNKYPNLNYYAVNSAKEEITSGVKTTAALTWGVFPNREIIQPTVFDFESFVVWSEEVFQLWTKCWASLYDDVSESADLLYRIHDTYYLVALIDNDYIEGNLLFQVFDEILEYDYSVNKKERPAKGFGLLGSSHHGSKLNFANLQSHAGASTASGNVLARQALGSASSRSNSVADSVNTAPALGSTVSHGSGIAGLAATSGTVQVTPKQSYDDMDAGAEGGISMDEESPLGSSSTHSPLVRSPISMNGKSTNASGGSRPPPSSRAHANNNNNNNNNSSTTTSEEDAASSVFRDRKSVDKPQLNQE